MKFFCLYERIVEKCAESNNLGLLGRKRGRNDRVPNPKPAHFAAGRQIERTVPVGFTYPIIAAFRANIDQEAWDNRQFKWKEKNPPFELLDSAISDLCAGIKEEYNEKRQQPALVGKNTGAYKGALTDLATFIK